MLSAQPKAEGQSAKSNPQSLYLRCAGCAVRGIKILLEFATFVTTQSYKGQSGKAVSFIERVIGMKSKKFVSALLAAVMLVAVLVVPAMAAEDEELPPPIAAAPDADESLIAPPPIAPAPTADEEQPPIAPAPTAAAYTVVKGDSLWKIAKNLLGSGSRWREIYTANKESIKDPNIIFAGQVLTIPQK